MISFTTEVIEIEQYQGHLKMTYFQAITILFLFLASACTSKRGPEETLREYISYAVSGDVSVEGFKSRSAGQLLERLNEMDEADFENYAQEMAHVDQNRIRIHSNTCDQERCSLTYTVTYDSKAEGEKIYQVEVRKIAELSKIEEVWKLSSINNVKSYYEGSREITDEDFREQNEGLSPDEIDQLKK